MEAQSWYDSGDYSKAADVLIPVMASDALARPLLLDCLVKLGDTPALIANFDPPASEAEAIHIMDALWAEGRRDRLGEVLRIPLVGESADPSVIVMRNKYATRLK